MNFDLKSDEFNKEVYKKFNQFKWKQPSITNLCGKKFRTHQTQEFVANYFSKDNPNGLFLYHSVGSGKTISGMELVKKFQEQYNYSVIWVTRTSLKEDLHKALKFVHPPNPFLVYSYKQFSNICSGSGKNYEGLVKIKGKVDILHNTLLIIDESHKLYSTEQLKAQEKHEIKAIEQKIFDSYVRSKENSVKVVLMSATPITQDFLEFVKMMNLLIADKNRRFPTNHSDFKQTYLNESGEFSKNGADTFKEQLKGIVSYIDMTKDPRKFVQVQYYELFVPISSKENVKSTKEQREHCKEIYNRCKSLGLNIDHCNDALKNCNARIPKELVYQEDHLKNKCGFNVENNTSKHAIKKYT